MKFDGNDITMVSGDSETITVAVTDESGEPFLLTTGDTIYFTVKRLSIDTINVFQIVVTEFADGKAIIDSYCEITNDKLPERLRLSGTGYILGCGLLFLSEIWYNVYSGERFILVKLVATNLRIEDKIMETRLVRLNTQDVSKAFPVTDSLIVSERIDYPHYRITRLIKSHIDDFGEFGAIDFERRLLNSKEVEIYLLTEGQFLLLVTYLRTTKTSPLVLKLKKQMVNEFLFMRKELQARVQTRQLSREVRKSLTDTIKSKVSDDGNFKKYSYSNYSKLVYKIITGVPVKKYKELNGLKETDNIRDFLSIDQLKQVQELESKIAFYIEMRTDLIGNDKEVYQEVKNYVDSLTDK